MRSNFVRAGLVVATATILGPLLNINMPRQAHADSVLPAWAPTGLNAPFDSTTGMFNLTANDTVRTRAALANAPNSAQNFVFVGDSITAGWNALNPNTFQGTIDRNSSWPYWFRRTLNSDLGLPAENSTGLVRAFELNNMGTNYMDGRWSPKPNGISVQAKGHYMNVISTSMTFNSAASGFTPIAGDSVGVTYIDSGNFSVSIDGKTAIKVPGTNTGQVMRFTQTGLPYKTHTIKVAAAYKCNIRIVGAEVYSNQGIVASDVAQGGSGVTGGGEGDWSIGGDPANSQSNTFSAPQAYSSQPSTVFIMLGGNDLNRNANDLSAIRDGILKTANFYPNSDIVLVAEYHGSQAFSSVDIHPLLTMLYQLAYDHNWPLWDTEYLTGGYEQLQAEGYTGDTYGHLTPAGYQMLGQTMANVIVNAPSQ